MPLAPRKSEIEPIEAILDSGEYEDATKMARAIVKVAFEAILEREWFVHAFQAVSGPPAILTGPFASENDAEKYGRSLGLDGLWRQQIFAVASVAERERAVAGSANGALPEVCECGHMSYEHKHEKGAGKCAHGNGPRWQGGCRCTKFIAKEEVAA